MNKLTIAFSALALGTLAGCGSDPVAPAPAPVVITPPPTVVTTPAPAATPAPAPTVVVQSTSAVRPGFGRIESIKTTRTTIVLDTVKETSALPIAAPADAVPETVRV